MRAEFNASSHISRLLKAIRCISPAGCPMGQIIPKFRTDAPLARCPRSNKTTRLPSLAST
jgi:hypothetical protein